MKLKSRVAKLERIAGPVVELDGPINITEVISGTLDLHSRMKLGRVGIRNAVLAFREAWEKIDWGVQDLDDDDYDIESHESAAGSS